MQISKYFLLAICTIIMVSCQTPNSKEQYLEQFDAFINRVEKNYKNYNSKDWEWADDKFEKYNHDWYLEFADDFTLQDQVAIKSLIIRYHSYKNKKGIGKMLRDLFKNDVNDMSEAVEDYVENDMDEDVEELLDGMTEIGDSAVKVLEDVIKELEHSF